MLWANRLLPSRLKEGKRNIKLDYSDARVQLLPIKSSSLRVLAESFRWIVKHLNTFSRSAILPTYKKQGTSSWTRLGFTNYHEGGISRRPTLPNANATYDYVHNMLKTMPHDPPFHTEIVAPPLPQNLTTPVWSDLPEIPEEKQDAFIKHLRYALFWKKDFDSISHPTAP